MENVGAMLALAQYAGPTGGGGGWNDMSLLLTPGSEEEEGKWAGGATKEFPFMRRGLESEVAG